MKHKTITNLISILVTTWGMVSYANAAAENHSSMDKKSDKTAVTAKYLEGMDVETPEGMELGTLDDMLMDLRSGTIQYYLVNTGFLGFGGETKAIPADDLTHKFRESGKLVYKNSQENFENLPNYQESMTPVENANALMENKSMLKGKYMALAMEVLNEDVYGLNGDRFGEAENWVINTTNNSVAYIIVRNQSFGIITRPSYDYYLIQANEVEKIDRHDSDIHLAVRSDQLDGAENVSETDLVGTMEKYDTLVIRYDPE